MSDDQILAVIKIMTTIPIMKEENLVETESLLLPLFSYLIERKTDYNIDLSNCTELKHKHFAYLMSTVLSDTQNKMQ